MTHDNKTECRSFPIAASIKVRAELVCSRRVAYGPSEAQKLETVSGPSTEQGRCLHNFDHSNKISPEKLNQ